ncbi:MAG: SHOCT domain-containing protein [Hespellia sp.]|nr:SHOCT domain-containing protein [Hespellia sp.]
MSKDTVDALNGIKALKELLDIGAITQSEFDKKKEQLLNS